MNINRDNYEMFFLLYVDNELSFAERKAVEAFAELNPDLGIELSILKETVLPADAVSFGNKEELYKSSEQDALQERMLLYLDNELKNDEKSAFEKDLYSTEELKKDWQILQKTKLDPSDTVIFPDKKSLYRHERGRIIAMRITRLAVAAMFIGAGLFFGYNLLKEQPTENTGVPVASKKDTKTPGSSAIGTPVVTEDRVNSDGVIPPAEKNEIHLAQTPKVKPGLPVSDKMPRNESAKTQIIKPKKQMHEETQPDSHLMAMSNPNKSMDKISPERTKEEMEMAKINRVSRPSITDVNLAAVDNSMARTAGVTNLEEEDDDKILYVDEDKVTRTKAAGFLRKLKRTVERNTRIKTGNGVRIAGFEFAVK